MANQYDTNLKLQAIADAIGDTQSSGLIQALEDIADAVAGGGGGSSAGLVSDNFSETDTYDLGDYCIHNNTLYVCINAITTPGPWDLSDWQATNAGMELSSLNSAITDLSDKFVFVTKEIPSTSINAGAFAQLLATADVVKTGYTLASLMYYGQGGYSGNLIVQFLIQGNNPRVEAYNAGNVTANAQGFINLLYIKD